MKVSKIRTLQTYTDWLEKAKHEYALYKESGGVYDLTNCLLTLNAIPEWIKKDELVPEKLKLIAIDKIAIMQKKKLGFKFNDNKLNCIDHQLYLLRMFCNHAKHSEKKYFPLIDMSTTLPAIFPIKYTNMKLGEKSIPMEPMLESIINFWEKEITSCQ